MHECDSIELELKNEAERISAAHNGAPVVILVAGDQEAGIRRVMTASTIKGRLRDLIGVLQTSIQIETLKHFNRFS